MRELELRQVFRVSNLQYLRIFSSKEPRESFRGEEIFKSWSSKARDASAFSRLAALWIEDEFPLPEKIFKYMIDFPVLAAFFGESKFHSRGAVEYARQHGWEYPQEYVQSNSQYELMKS